MGRVPSKIPGMGVPRTPPRADFHSFHYLRHTFRVMEHLASLNLDLRDKRVLEVSAGIGDLTTFFLDRGCSVVATDVRPENLQIMAHRFAGEKRVTLRQLDLDPPPRVEGPPQETFDVVFFFGVLYHLSTPERAIDYLAPLSHGLFLLESCVSLGDHEAINPVAEESQHPSQAATGRGCRPTRPWIFGRLKRHFPYVAMPTTQPNFANFAVDWTVSKPEAELTRAIFVASRTALANPLLVEGIPSRQTRH